MHLVFDELECAGEGLSIEMADMLPATCQDNVFMSCEDKPMAMVENWCVQRHMPRQKYAKIAIGVIF